LEKTRNAFVRISKSGVVKKVYERVATQATQVTQRFVDFFFKKKYLTLGGLGGLGGLVSYKLFLEKTRNAFVRILKVGL